MSKQVNYNENLCAGAAIRDDKGRRISKLFEASHPKMTVGYAKNLIMPDDPTEQKFNFRQSGGGLIEDGVAVIDKVKGKSIVWNQLVKKTEQAETTVNGLTFYPQENGEVLITGVATENAYAATYNYLGYDYTSVANHKAFVQIFGDATRTMKLYVTDDKQAMTDLGIVQWGTVAAGGVLFIPKGYDCGQGVRLRFIVIDLTQMFGAGNEPATIEEFLQRKPKVEDEFAYNEGTIVNNKVEKVVTTGVNLWDEEWELGAFNNVGEEVPNSGVIRTRNFVRIDSSKSCFVKAPYTLALFYYDENKNFISTEESKNNTLNIPANACYLRFRTALYYGTTYNNDICINLSDPTINGQYFPYEKHELDLAWVKDIKDAEGVKLFEGGMRSAGTTYDEVGKGRAIKRIGVKVFDGNVAINKGETSGDAYRVLISHVITTSSNGVKNTLALNGDGVYAQYNGGYYYDKYAIGFASVTDIWFCLPSSVAQNISQVRTYLEEHPITFIYELAEPIEVEYDEKNLTYPVVAGGTEEAIASEPSSAFRADIGYGIDAVKTILDLKARVEALEEK